MVPILLIIVEDSCVSSDGVSKLPGFRQIVGCAICFCFAEGTSCQTFSANFTIFAFWKVCKTIMLTFGACECFGFLPGSHLSFWCLGLVFCLFLLGIASSCRENLFSRERRAKGSCCVGLLLGRSCLSRRGCGCVAGALPVRCGRIEIDDSSMILTYLARK